MRIYSRVGLPALNRLPKQVGNSITYYKGDLVVLSTLNALAGGDPALRPLATADATAFYETAGGDICGILGVCQDDAVVNSSGIITSRPTAVTVDTSAQPIYTAPAVGSTLPTSTEPRSRILIDIIDSQTMLAAVLLETTTITEDLIGLAVGLSMVVTSGVTAWKFSTAAATKIFRIEKVVKTDPLYNVSGGGGEVVCRLNPAYQQDLTTSNYAT